MGWAANTEVETDADRQWTDDYRHSDAPEHLGARALLLLGWRIALLLWMGLWSMRLLDAVEVTRPLESLRPLTNLQELVLLSLAALLPLTLLLGSLVVGWRCIRDGIPLRRVASRVFAEAPYALAVGPLFGFLAQYKDPFWLFLAAGLVLAGPVFLFPPLDEAGPSWRKTGKTLGLCAVAFLVLTLPYSPAEEWKRELTALRVQGHLAAWSSPHLLMHEPAEGEEWARTPTLLRSGSNLAWHFSYVLGIFPEYVGRGTSIEDFQEELDPVVRFRCRNLERIALELRGSRWEDDSVLELPHCSTTSNPGEARRQALQALAEAARHRGAFELEGWTNSGPLFLSAFDLWSHTEKRTDLELRLATRLHRRRIERHWGQEVSENPRVLFASCSAETASWHLCWRLHQWIVEDFFAAGDLQGVREFLSETTGWFERTLELQRVFEEIDHRDDEILGEFLRSRKPASTGCGYLSRLEAWHGFESRYASYSWSGLSLVESWLDEQQECAASGWGPISCPEDLACE